MYLRSSCTSSCCNSCFSSCLCFSSICSFRSARMLTRSCTSSCSVPSTQISAAQTYVSDIALYQHVAHSSNCTFGDSLSRRRSKRQTPEAPFQLPCLSYQSAERCVNQPCTNLELLDNVRASLHLFIRSHARVVCRNELLLQVLHHPHCLFEILVLAYIDDHHGVR